VFYQQLNSDDIDMFMDNTKFHIIQNNDIFAPKTLWAGRSPVEQKQPVHGSLG